MAYQHWISRALIVLAAAGCAATRASWLAPAPTGGAAAYATADGAEFVFPAPAHRQFVASAEDIRDGFADEPFIWQVYWSRYMDFRDIGRLPHGIEARAGLQRELQPGEDSLQALLAGARRSRMVYGDVGDLPASAMYPEPALKVAARRGQVVLSVRGRKALRRIWPAGVPDTVSFWWREPGLEGQAEDLPVPVVRLTRPGDRRD